MTSNYMTFFERFMGTGEKHNDVPQNIIEEFKGVFLGASEQIDIITEIWEKHGFSNYKNGLFSLVNPNEYSSLARKFPNISSEVIVFAKSCIGGLFAWENLSVGWSIIYINVHKGTRNVVGTRFGVTLLELDADSFWKRECYGKFELKVIEKYGSLAYDECYAFIPALALGGSESIKNIQKVKVKEHLEFLSQLY